jgi:hypothetical protein
VRQRGKKASSNERVMVVAHHPHGFDPSLPDHFTRFPDDDVILYKFSASVVPLGLSQLPHGNNILSRFTAYATFLVAAPIGTDYDLAREEEST